MQVQLILVSSLQSEVSKILHLLKIFEIKIPNKFGKIFFMSSFHDGFWLKLIAQLEKRYFAFVFSENSQKEKLPDFVKVHVNREASRAMVCSLIKALFCGWF